MSVQHFYDDFSVYYHLIYDNWDASMSRQGKHLDAVIRSVLPQGELEVLDAACGIGTQSMGLAISGGAYRITGCDLSPASISRAKLEAAKRGLEIAFSPADMLKLHDTIGQRQFDVVLACDNAVPHLLNDQLIGEAFGQFYKCTKEGGLCLISVRDYANIPASGTQVHPYGVRELDGKRVILLQLWEFSGSTYQIHLYMLEDDGYGHVHARVFRTTYYAVGTERLAELMTEAGFREVCRLDGVFFQPILIGIK